MQTLYSYHPQKQTARNLQGSERLLESSHKTMHRHIRRRLISGLFVIVAISLFIAWSGVLAPKQSAKASQTAEANAVATAPALERNATIASLIAKNSQYQIGVTVESVASGQQQTYGITTPFEAASTAKLITAAAYYHLAEQGQASLTAMLGAYPASYQLQQMVNQSNNESWNLLVDAIGLSTVQSYADSIGVAYGTDGNTLPPSAMATFLTKLYNGQLLNSADTAQLLGYMQDTNDETLIPAVVPSDMTVYHKYGLLNGELHDVAILTKGNTAYAIVVYTKDADDSTDDDRTTIIHQITQATISQLFNES
ncbi:MAG TPA: serine hydrolase [Dongiaceae bacterium]|nr:serine hydrolase [Dongiaceae bacterium]